MLVADDDPVSLRFLEAAIVRCGCDAVTAVDSASALAAAARSVFALLLLDRRMPGSDAIGLLRELRARGVHAPAIATSAEFGSEVAAELRAAGFADLLAKPAGLAEIAALLARYVTLPLRPDHVVADSVTRGEPLLDDKSALIAIGGDADALAALRALFRGELDSIIADLDGNRATDPPALRERLHRLAASCGFCGAAALRASAVRLDHELAAIGADAVATRDFLTIARATAERLAASRRASIA